MLKRQRESQPLAEQDENAQWFPPAWKLGTEGAVAVEDTSVDDVRAFLVSTREEVLARDEAARVRHEAASEHRTRNAHRVAQLIVMQVHDKALAEMLVRFGEAYREGPTPAKSTSPASRLWSHAYWLSGIRAHAAPVLGPGQRDEFLEALGHAYLELLPVP